KLCRSETPRRDANWLQEYHKSRARFAAGGSGSSALLLSTREHIKADPDNSTPSAISRTTGKSIIPLGAVRSVFLLADFLTFEASARSAPGSSTIEGFRPQEIAECVDQFLLPTIADRIDTSPLAFDLAHIYRSNSAVERAAVEEQRQRRWNEQLRRAEEGDFEDLDFLAAETTKDLAAARGRNRGAEVSLEVLHDHKAEEVASSTTGEMTRNEVAGTRNV
ncbi:unnamed protein product, partial [Amoebophrya sp. A120]